MQLNCRRRSAMQLTQLKRTANQREAGQLDWVELSCVGVAIDTSPTQLDSMSSWVELCRYKRALRLSLSLNLGLKSGLRPNHQHEVKSCLKSGHRPKFSLRLQSKTNLTSASVWVLSANLSSAIAQTKVWTDWSLGPDEKNDFNFGWSPVSVQI